MSWHKMAAEALSPAPPLRVSQSSLPVPGAPRMLVPLGNKAASPPPAQDAPRIVVAVDGTEQAADAFLVYAHMLHKAGNYVRVVHVLQIVEVPPSAERYECEEDYEREQRMREDQAQQVRYGYGRKMREMGIIDDEGRGGEVIVLEGGEPAQTLVRYANLARLDMLVIGSRGYGRLKRFFKGSVSEYVKRHAKCQVVIVRTGTANDN